MLSGEEEDSWESGASGAAEEEETVEDLREKQRIAIQEMNFEYADELQQKITALSEKHGDDGLRMFRAELKKSCEDCASGYAARRRKLLRSFHRQEIAVRRAITDEFVKKQTTHKQQIKNLEESLFAQFKDRMNKPIPVFDEMTQRARQAALRGEFKTAQELRDDARVLQTQELERRREQFEANYKIQINGLLDRQRLELADLTDRMNKGIESVEKKRKAGVEQEVVAFRRQLQKEYQRIVNMVRPQKYDPRDQSPPMEVTVTAEMRPVILKDLAATFDEVLKKFGVAKITDEDKALPTNRAALRSPSKASSAASSVYRGKR